MLSGAILSNKAYHEIPPCVRFVQCIVLTEPVAFLALSQALEFENSIHLFAILLRHFKRCTTTLSLLACRLYSVVTHERELVSAAQHLISLPREAVQAYPGSWAAL